MLRSEHIRKLVIKNANLWLGTPYQHQASYLGVGSDCLGLIRGIYKKIYKKDPCHIPNYSRRVYANEPEILLEMAQNYLNEIVLETLLPGHVLLFRMRLDLPARHLGILVDDNHMIHAAEGHFVLKSVYNHWWRRKTVAAFSFPEYLKKCDSDV